MTIEGYKKDKHKAERIIKETLMGLESLYDIEVDNIRLTHVRSTEGSQNVCDVQIEARI